MAKVKSRTKAGATAPQNKDEAARYIREIGDNSREIARIEADMNDEIAQIKEQAGEKASPLAERSKELTEGLRTWCEANRVTLTDNLKRKWADLGAGKVEWRSLPPKVTIKGVDLVLETIKTLGLLQFTRVKWEIDKEAMLREPEKARLVQGVTIGSEGENFSVEPFELVLEGGK